MAGVTTLPVREFFTRLGADLTHTEMISCSGLIRENKKTLDMIKISKNESPIVVQLFTSDENIIISSAEVVLKEYKPYAFGINMACPMPKIIKNGSGSALLKKPDAASKMIKNLKKLNFPVWAKIRKFENDNDTLRFIEILLNSGADNVCVHGRTPSQRYEGLSDKKIISLAAEKFPSYISASGDVKTVNDIHEYLSMGCENVMIARGAVENPWIFSEFKFNYKKINLKEKIKDLIILSKRTEEISGEHKAIVILKRFAPYLFRNYEGSAKMRNLIMQTSNLDKLVKIINQGGETNAEF